MDWLLTAIDAGKIRRDCVWGFCWWIWWNAINAGQFNDVLCWYFDFQMMQAGGLIATNIEPGQKNGIVLRMLWVDLIKCYQCWSIRLFIVLIFRFSNNAGRWIDFHYYWYWTNLTWCCLTMLRVYLVESYEWWSIQWWIVLIFWFSNDAGGWIDR